MFRYAFLMHDQCRYAACLSPHQSLQLQVCYTSVLQGLTVEIAAVVCCRDFLKKQLIAAKRGHIHYQ